MTPLHWSLLFASLVCACASSQGETSAAQGPRAFPEVASSERGAESEAARPEAEAAPPAEPEPEPEPEFRVAAWLPYWHRAQGATIAAEHITSFDSVSPFAFAVQPNGTLINRMSRRADQWTALEESARAAGVTVIPSLAWMKGSEQHDVLSDPARRAAHIDTIVTLVEERHFDGIDVDYEGKAVEDIPHFSAFLRELSARLRPMNVSLVCTVEGRPGEAFPEDANYGQRMPYAVDFAALGEACDEVRLMAYGQWFLDNGSREFSSSGGEPYAPNSDNAWVERVIRYALGSIPASKIVLGVPTHGRFFNLGGRAGAWTYESRGAIHFERVQELLELPSALLDRPSGEARLRWGRGASRRLAYLSDAVTLQQRIELAQRLGIAGIALFKIDGREDPAIWPVLERLRSARVGAE
ncbi:MAG: glycosyl hydrolase family 18 protein [Polyangiales bacterium]